MASASRHRSLLKSRDVGMKVKGGTRGEYLFIQCRGTASAWCVAGGVAASPPWHHRFDHRLRHPPQAQARIGGRLMAGCGARWSDSARTGTSDRRIRVPNASPSVSQPLRPSTSQGHPPPHPMNCMTDHPSGFNVRTGRQSICAPPVAFAIVAVMPAARSLARSTAALATSASGVMRRSGVSLENSLWTSSNDIPFCCP